jgi:hypothetical protein
MCLRCQNIHLDSDAEKERLRLQGAGTLKPDSFEKRSFLPSKTIEFQISRERS